MGKTTPKVPFFKDSRRCPKILDYTLEVYQQAKNRLHPSFSLRYCKDVVKMLFWIIWACLAKHTQSDTMNMYKTCVYLQAKNQLHLSCFSGDMQNYFGYFGNAWLHTPKTIVSTFSCNPMSCSGCSALHGVNPS